MRRYFLPTIALAGALAMAGCSTAPHSARNRHYLTVESRSSVRSFEREGVMQHSLRHAYAYAVFPSITTAAVGVGGAYGKGEVFRRGGLIGYTDLTQGTIGVQLGGAVYSELVLFKNHASFARFKRGQLVFTAAARAVAASHGAGVTPDYSRGVAVYTMHQGGLMFQAALGGQQFDFRPRAGSALRRHRRGMRGRMHRRMSRRMSRRSMRNGRSRTRRTMTVHTHRNSNGELRSRTTKTTTKTTRPAHDHNRNANNGNTTGQ